MSKNKKVPIAVLSCFLIAFVLQGLLKICGVFIFEKALTWDVFNIIDEVLWLNILFNSAINIIAVYCLSFCLTTKPYSKRWYHYAIIVASSVGMMTLKLLVQVPIKWQFLCDVFLYVIVPVIINLTSNKEETIFKNKSFILGLSIQILLYFCYLGLCYWSGLLNSLLFTEPIMLNSMTSFLLFFEEYIGLISLMLSCNCLIYKIKSERTDMVYPQNIASEEAKKKALEQAKAKKQHKKSK